MTTVPEPSDSAFDAHHPPDPELLSDCVHCGFCLPACPTYTLWGEEMDSPRGRIYLMDLAARGETAIDDVFVTHMDRCLGCMACVTACPSGVQYDKLIEATRPQIERHHERSRADRWWRALLFWLFPHPARLRAAAVFGWLYQRSGARALAARSGLAARLPDRIRALDALLPDIRLGQLWRRQPERVAPVGPPRLRVALMTGCVQRVFFGDVNAATARVLAAEGAEVLIPRGQPCCGALMEHAGAEQAALAHARRMIAAMERVDADVIVTNAAGCGSTLKEYGHLLRDDPVWSQRAAQLADRVRDVMEVCDELGSTAPRHPIDARVAYHDACHLAHAQGVRAAPRRVLSTIPGLDLVDLPEADLCCGSAGVYNLLQPRAAEDLGRRKAAIITEMAPTALVTGNPGCLLQLRRHLDASVPLLHPVQLLDAAIAGHDPTGGAAPVGTGPARPPRTTGNGG